MAMHRSLDELNTLSKGEAAIALRRCCAAEAWVLAMVHTRPFTSVEQLLKKAEDVWWNLHEGDFMEAFSAHPKIGDVRSLRAKYADTHSLAANEQAGAHHVDDAVLEALAEGNRAYEKKFGFIFIVCATGKSAAEMLVLLQQRLLNSHVQEVRNAAENQAQITAIRLNKLLATGTK